jgi:hypothetical protein
MSVEQTINFSDDTFLYFHITKTSNSYTMRFDGKNKNFNIVFSKSQFQEMIGHLVNEDFIVVDEDGEIQVEV